MTQILVAYGSRHGGTAEIAHWIGEELRKAGLRVDVCDARSVREVTPYHAAILGGAVYAGRWQRDARRLARKQERVLREMPVWLFGSGPLGGGAGEPLRLPGWGMRRIAERLGARDHVTFGGRLRKDVRGLLSAPLAKRFAGDYRDEEAVRAWARRIAAELPSRSPRKVRS
ncbi:flavodoxin domain-containing protein [Actinoallomurus acanthiterrae]